MMRPNVRHPTPNHDEEASVTENPLLSTAVNPRSTRVSIQQRAVHAGEALVVNGFRVNREALKRRFAQGGYQAQETPHCLLLTRPQEPSTILVHGFAPETSLDQLAQALEEELTPLGVLTRRERLDELLAGVIGSMQYTGDLCRVWNALGASTLPHVLTFLRQASALALPDTASLSMAALLYQRVGELCVGEQFLDVGCQSGFFSVLLAQRRPFVVEVVGVDRDESAFAVGQKLAAERHLRTVRFVQADLLSDLFPALGQFDTVTALHVLDHLPEAQTTRALTHLLRVTRHRLIIAVPYAAGTPEAEGCHQQWFSREKLEAMGQWCLQQMQGAGRMWCEDLIGGLLLIERLS